MKRSIDSKEMKKSLGYVPVDHSAQNDWIDSYDPLAEEQAAQANQANFWDMLSTGLQTGADLLTKLRTNSPTATPPSLPPTDSGIPWKPLAIGGAALMAVVLLINNKK